MKARPLVGLAILTLLPLSAQELQFRLVPRAPEPPAPAGRWFESFAAAEAAAKERHTNLLLYFTAKW